MVHTDPPGPAVAEAHRELVGRLRPPVAGDLRVLGHGDAGHYRPECRIGDSVRGERRLGHPPVGESDRDDVGEAVVGGLPPLGIPFLVVIALASPDQIPGDVVGGDLDRLYVVGPDALGVKPTEHLGRDLSLEVRRVELAAGALNRAQTVHRRAQAVKIEGPGGLLPQPELALERLRRAGDARRGQTSREQRGHGRVGGGAPLPVGKLAGPGHEQRHVRGDRHTHRVGQPLRVEPQHPARAGRGGDGKERPVVPAVVPHGHRVGQGREHLVGDVKRRQDFRSGAGAYLGRGQHSPHHVAGVAAALSVVGVVEVEVADHAPVGECGQLGGRRPGQPDHRRTRFSGSGGREGAGRHAGGRVQCPQRASERVDEAAPHGVRRGLRNPGRVESGRVPGDQAGGGVEHGRRPRTVGTSRVTAPEPELVQGSIRAWTTSPPASAASMASSASSSPKQWVVMRSMGH